MNAQLSDRARGYLCAPTRGERAISCGPIAGIAWAIATALLFAPAPFARAQVSHGEVRAAEFAPTVVNTTARPELIPR